VQENKSLANKRAIERRDMDRDTELQKWRDVDMKTECFILEALPPSQAFSTFRLRRESHPTLLSIFLRLFSPEIVQHIFEKLGNFIFVGMHPNSNTFKRYKVTKRKIYQTIAVSLVIIAEQKKSAEVRDNGHFMRKRVA
jgi:hypothetical protein